MFLVKIYSMFAKFSQDSIASHYKISIDILKNVLRISKLMFFFFKKNFKNVQGMKNVSWKIKISEALFFLDNAKSLKYLKMFKTLKN